MAKIDWLQGSINSADQRYVERYLAKLTGCEGNAVGGRNTYSNCTDYDGLAFVCYDHADIDTSIHRNRISITLCGQLCGCMSSVLMHQVMSDLQSVFNFACSRIDIAYDDIDRITNIGVVHQACEAQLMSGYRVYRHVVESNSGRKIGETLYLGKRGKRGSGKMLRIYDKGLESNGAINAIRWELEVTGKQAKGVFESSCICPNLSAQLGFFLGGCVDFFDCYKVKRNRAKRAGWWQELINILGRESIVTPIKQSTIDSKGIWIEASVSDSLAMIKMAIGNDRFTEWLDGLIVYACNNMSDKNLQMIAQYQRCA